MPVTTRIPKSESIVIKILRRELEAIRANKFMEPELKQLQIEIIKDLIKQKLES